MKIVVSILDIIVVLSPQNIREMNVQEVKKANLINGWIILEDHGSKKIKIKIRELKEIKKPVPLTLAFCPTKNNDRRHPSRIPKWFWFSTSVEHNTHYRPTFRGRYSVWTDKNHD